MLHLFLINFISFPSRKDSIFSKVDIKDIKTDVVGSSGLYYSSKCHPTYPNETLTENEKTDWCSSIIPKDSKDIKPWITFSIKNKAFKVNGYSLRNGCCWYDCCCSLDGAVYDGICCCRLYSFSLLGSNDNTTWKLIHRVERDKTFWRCKYMTYEFPETETFRYLKLVQNEPFPGCYFCMQLNQIDFYGELINSDYLLDDGIPDEDETISIIGKIKQSNE